MTPLSGFFRTPRPRRCRLIEAALFLGLVRVGLAVLPFNQARRTAAVMSRALRWFRRPTAADDLEELSSAVEAVARIMRRTTCLARALAVQALAESHGCPAVVCVGVRRGVHGEFAAHAWVQRQTAAVAPAPEGYRTLATFERLWP